ncbi:WD repeat-containing protein 43, partial [Nowakowskiella sp. JEL0078]
ATSVQAFDINVLSAFDNSSDFFATISKTINAQRLHIFNTNTSSVSVEISAPQGVDVTSVSWGSIQLDSEEKSLSFEKIVALGLSTGDIAFCSAAQGSMVKTLSGGHTSPVSDVCFFKNGEELISAGHDGFVILWDGKTGEQKHKFCADSKPISKVRISHDQKHLLVAGHQIMLWEISTWKLQQKYSGHTSPVVQIMFSPDDSVCASIAENDRSVYVWNTSEHKTPTNIAVLSVESLPIQLDVSLQGHVLVVTNDGVAYFWGQFGADLVSAEKSGSKKKAKLTSRRPEGTLKIISSTADAAVEEEINGIETQSARIPVIAATFSNGKVLTCRGGFTRPIFERLTYLDESELILEDISILRTPSSIFGITSTQTKYTKQPSLNQRALVLEHTESTLPKQATKPSELTIEERLKDLSIEKNKHSEELSFLAGQQKSSNSVSIPETSSNRLPSSRRFNALNVSSLSVLLSQALESDDKTLLEQALSVSDPTLIYATIRRLQVEQVVPLLDALVVRLQRMPNRARQNIEWMRAIVMTHTGFLVSTAKSSTSTTAGGMGELPKQLGALYQTIDSHNGVYRKLIKLTGRLDLVVHQIQARNAQTPLEDEEEVTLFNEDDDDNEDSDDSEDSEDFDEDEDMNEENAESEDDEYGEEDEEDEDNEEINEEEQDMEEED